MAGQIKYSSKEEKSRGSSQMRKINKANEVASTKCSGSDHI